MKAIKNGVLIILALIFRQNGDAQGFLNLNFEAANVSGYSSGDYFPIGSALPGWSGFYTSSDGTIPATHVWYNGISLGGAAISIIDANAPVFRPIQGSYSAFLFGGGPNPLFGGRDGVLYFPTISQTGLVPNGTASLFVDASFSGTSLIVTL